jgi:Icc-related predicted phosphoesterase
MKTKVVLWGENASNEKVLIAMELLEKDNKVMIYVFPLEVATETFYQSMLDQWREGKPLDFPQPHQVIDRPLTMTDSILPDELKVERTDLISRAQAEWHFVVLSSKLYDMYKEELDDIKTKIDSISEYDDKLWQEAKTFWGKVQEQVREQNLFKEHSITLKEKTNALFEKLKDLRKSLQNDFEKVSQDAAAKFYEEIKDVDDKIEKGLGLKPLFEQMKAIQEKYYKAQLTKEDRKNVWDKLDATFKAMKDKRPAGGGNGKPMENKTQSRYDGLIATISMMEKSILRDKQDYDFQVKKIEQTDGQLEMQIRQAKLKMLEERINSKDEKLQDMYKVKIELEGRMSKDEARKASDAKKTEAKEVVKQKIAVDIESAKEDRETMADLLENAAAKIKDSKSKKPVSPDAIASQEKETPKEESFFEAISTTLTETFEDVVDTVKAIAEVAEDKIEHAMDAVEDKMDIVEDKIEAVVEDLKSDDKSEEKPAEEDNKEGDKA